jgi:Eco57I restriction-modification methylase
MLSLDQVTRKFYNCFKTERTIFTQAIFGIPTEAEREEYASFLLNRLLFLAFVQKKGFLDSDTHYFFKHLRLMQERQGYNTFYRHFLLRLFREGLGTQARSPELQALLGKVPYLGDNLFELPPLEQSNPTIQIPDVAFERLFAFLDTYQWHLDDHQPLHEREMSPSVLGYIFEQHINQQHMGAYYTREDVTMYIANNTIIPYLFDAAERLHPGGLCIGGGAEGNMQSIDDFVTDNLDLCRLAQDVLTKSEEPAWIEAFYESLTKITILDPTCGSGAFLLAALRVLERLYDVCLARMYRRGNQKNQLPTNNRYLIRKAIITNNLYGVDIMQEAVEICKLRLYLALLSEIEHVEDIEPLPEIDHNIRTGNALVGDVHPDLTTDEQTYANHQPFHWYSEFGQIMNNAGFAVIIGNPPYVEYEDKKFPYTLQNFETCACSNLYTCVVERSHHLLSSHGRHGMILPLAAFATRNMIPFIERFRCWFPCTWLSFYHFRPSMLFAGGKVASIPTVIYLGKHSGNEARFSTHVAKWTAGQRDSLFSSLTYCRITTPKDPDNRHYYPKFGDPIENSIMEKVLRHKRVGNYLASTPNSNTMYYRSAGGLYWKVFVNFAWPYSTTSNKQCSFQPSYDRDVFVALFNSSLFWWYYTVTFDTFNLKDYMLFGFRFTYPDDGAIVKKLQDYCNQLMVDYRKNAKHLKRGKTGSYTIYAKKSKPILDEIDRVLAQHYRFTDEEVEFILNYDLKYRMGQENGEES